MNEHPATPVDVVPPVQPVRKQRGPVLRRRQWWDGLRPVHSSKHGKAKTRPANYKSHKKVRRLMARASRRINRGRTH